MVSSESNECRVVVVVAEGELVKTVGGGGLFNTGSLDIEDNTNSFVGLQNKPIILPFAADGSFRSTQFCG